MIFQSILESNLYLEQKKTFISACITDFIKLHGGYFYLKLENIKIEEYKIHIEYIDKLDPEYGISIKMNPGRGILNPTFKGEIIINRGDRPPIVMPSTSEKGLCEQLTTIHLFLPEGKEYKNTEEYGINMGDVQALVSAGVGIEPILMSDFFGMMDVKVSIDDVDGDIIYLLFDFLDGYQHRIIVLPNEKVNLLDEIAFARNKFKKEQQC